jgi:hypothetical protein
MARQSPLAHTPEPPSTVHVRPSTCVRTQALAEHAAFQHSPIASHSVSDVHSGGVSSGGESATQAVRTNRAAVAKISFFTLFPKTKFVRAVHDATNGHRSFAMSRNFTFPTKKVES